MKACLRGYGIRTGSSRQISTRQSPLVSGDILRVAECYNFAVRERLTLRARRIPFRVLDNVGEWLSLVEHLVRDQGVGGSNPLSPTNNFVPSFQGLADQPIL